ncbi:DNA adenine methylase [Candidatus Margulisiibacteriota bacterium]
MIQKTKLRKKINTPFGYFGSKNKIALQLCKELPPHNCWVEAFCGSAALTLRKTPAKIEIINDIDNEIVNLFEQLRNNTEKLVKSIELTPYAEYELHLARKSSDENISNLERARQFLVQSMMAINGVFGKERGGFSYSDSYSRNNCDARVNRWNNLPERLSIVVDRLKSVRIENKDARKILQRYLHRPATLIYLDPPYLTERTNGYNIDMNDDSFHEELLDLSNEANCMIFISGYENKLYNSLLTSKRGWMKKEIKTITKDSKGTIHNRVEVVWMNKLFIKALKNNKIPISLTNKESTHNKVNPERK